MDAAQTQGILSQDYHLSDYLFFEPPYPTIVSVYLMLPAIPVIVGQGFVGLPDILPVHVNALPLSTPTQLLQVDFPERIQPHLPNVIYPELILGRVFFAGTPW